MVDIEDFKRWMRKKRPAMVRFFGNSVASTLSGTPVTFASMAASALPKQGAVAGADFTTTSATLVDITGATVTTNGAALVNAAAQLVPGAVSTQSFLNITASAGTLSGIWLVIQNATINAVALASGANFNTGASIQWPSGGTNTTTLDGIFVGIISAAATVKLQLASDGIRTATVKIGSFVASSI